MRFSCTFLKQAVGLIMLLAKTLKSLLMLFILNEIVARRMPWHVPSIYMESFHHGHLHDRCEIANGGGVIETLRSRDVRRAI